MGILWTVFICALTLLTASSVGLIAQPVSVKIDEQEWMLRNLDVKHFRNGDSIPEVKSQDVWRWSHEMKSPAWCYYENDSLNGNRLGILYNYHAVIDPRGLAPNGWRVPDTEDWRKLARYHGVEELQGHRMKDSVGWCNEGSGSNSFGFTGLPGGRRDEVGYFSMIDCEGYWWSTSPINPDRISWSFRLGSNTGWVGNLYGIHGVGMSVRCIRDGSTSTNDHQELLSHVYPNPATGNQVLYRTGRIVGGKLVVKAIDNIGRLTMLTGSQITDAVSIDIGQLPAGTYLIVISSDEWVDSAVLVVN